MKRMTIAILVMLGATALTGELLKLAQFAQWQFQPALAGLLGAGFGGYVARTRFVAVALLLHFVTWLVLLYTLLGVAPGQSTFMDIASNNALAMAISFPLVGFGAWLGQWLAARLSPVPALPPTTRN